MTDGVKALKRLFIENVDAYFPYRRIGEKVINERSPYQFDANAYAFDTCAVAGTGGILLKGEHGDAINAHEAVFRMNMGVTAGFEKHVGS